MGSDSTLIHPVEGVRLATAASAARYQGRADLALIEICAEGNVAAVFTRNAFCAAPIQLAREHLYKASPRYLLINSGQANAGTGEAGLEDARKCCQIVAELAETEVESILPFSTGVIGERLAMEQIQFALPSLFSDLDPDHWRDAADAIRTTDTVAKIASRRVQIEGEWVTVTGIAKGSGMICPDMATMLAFVATDAEIPHSLLQGCLKSAVDQSFNRITVDGDTSTNDACVLIATGSSRAPVVGKKTNSLQKEVQLTIEAVFEDLAKAIVRDGEGATKLVAVHVSGGKTRQECRSVAYTIAHSPLVKTALFAEDPNWGRLLAAIGRADIEHLDICGVQIYLDDVCIVRGGERAPDYEESRAAEVLRRNEYEIQVRLGRGDSSETIWTCDLSYEYVRINAEYRS
ncbi:MAG: bifunctional glutamate N-acetyltransferase/amino-acid acetyltransferase ArgJ [Gammaproteobacteria bacterium]|nr:MAG: bifunctional glutamate N-acetyltransferase/amino-acid acetyltransferase ArgJ [Gammaproteobacteria bacterium]